MNTPIQKAVSQFGSQAELSRALGVTRATVNSWVKGRNQITPSVALKIQEITNGAVNARDLVFGSFYDHKT